MPNSQYPSQLLELLKAFAIILLEKADIKSNTAVEVEILINCFIINYFNDYRTNLRLFNIY